eukprot:13229713-Ditylum_brightwellii.AAC.1
MKEDSLSIMQPFICAILPKLGLNCNSPREIIYGSMKYGEFHLLHLYLEQGYLAVKHLIRHSREETIVGVQIMILLSYVQLVSGSGFTYLDKVYANRSYVPATWLGSIQSFLAVCKGTAVVLNVWLPKIQ